MIHPHIESLGNIIAAWKETSLTFGPRKAPAHQPPAVSWSETLGENDELPIVEGASQAISGNLNAGLSSWIFH